jgi:hypothetical protein
LLRFHNIPELRKETGFAFVWILILLVITSALSLAFLQKASIGTSAAVTRGSAMQAHYLARAAANHALWRLLNEPHFTASETVYYMHDLGNGRYGYKLRKPTLTKFGTVATVGGVSDVVTNQSYVQYLKPYNIITAYGRSSDQIPEYRRLLGATWVDAADTVDIGSDTVQWMVLKGCPVRKEVIMGALDNDDDINLAVWSGTSWDNPEEFTQTANKSVRCFDIAYESQSGDALMVGMFDASTDIKYMGWDGTDWVPSSPTAAFNLDSSVLNYLTMASNPKNDEILIATVSAQSDFKLVQWDGSSFNDLGEIDDSTETKAYGSVAIVYEQQSGDGLILWNKASANQISYRVWNGVSLSSEYLLPDFDGSAQVIWAAADPTSDYIFVASVDGSKNLHVAFWDGDAWDDSPRELSTNVVAKIGQVLDVAWEHTGGDVMVAWGTPDAGTNVRYFTWQKGTTLAAHAVQTGPDFQNAVSLVRLRPISGSQKIILLANNSSYDLRYSLWTGNKFLGDPAILSESSLATSNLPFDIASGVTE